MHRAPPLHETLCGGRFRSSPTPHTSSNWGSVDLTVGTPDMDMRATPVSSHTTNRDPSEYGVSFESQPKRVAGTQRARPRQDPCNATESKPVPLLQDLSGATVLAFRSPSVTAPSSVTLADSSCTQEPAMISHRSRLHVRFVGIRQRRQTGPGRFVSPLVGRPVSAR